MLTRVLCILKAKEQKEKKEKENEGKKEIKKEPGTEDTVVSADEKPMETEEGGAKKAAGKKRLLPMMVFLGWKSVALNSEKYALFWPI